MLFMFPLCPGLFDPSWRIRQSSVELLGALMYRIAGVKAIVPESEIDIENEAEMPDQFVPATTSMLSLLLLFILARCICC